MKLKISLIDQVFRKPIGKKIRNFIGIKPSSDLIDYTSEGVSVSDAFFWRTDDNFETIFKFTNILKYFCKVKSSNIKLLFFSNKNELIKEHYLYSPNNHSEIIINKSFLNNIESYGVFYIFHETDEKLKTIIRNSCYTGYSWNNNLPSMVHGNTMTAEMKIENKKINYGIGAYTFFKKKTYSIQNNFEFKQKEIMLVNPTKTKIKFKVNEKVLELNKGCTKLISVDESKLIKITSKCYLLRPIIFERSGEFINVYHG